MDLALMFDCSGDARPLIGHLGLRGCVAVGRYLFAGATAADGSVPEPVATPLQRDEADAIHAAGLAVLLIDNGIGFGDLTGPGAYDSGVRKAQAAVAAADTLGAPDGSYVAFDLETWAADPAFLRGYCDAMRQSRLGGAGIAYGSADAFWRGAFAAASASNPNVARALVWTARYIGSWNGTPPAWDPQDDAGDRTVAWQFCDQGPQGVDLSLLRLPIPGPGGLWLPGGATGSPKLPGVPS